MPHKKLLIAVILALSAMLVTASALASPVQTPATGHITNNSILWQLSQGRVVDRGQTVATPEGVLTSGFVVEAKVNSFRPSLFLSGETAGNFRIVLSAFSPKEDMPGQKAGRWYIQGEWTLTEANADAAVLEFRHNPSALKGSFQLEASTNPLTTRGAPAQMEGSIRLPMSLAGGRWIQATGHFSGNALFEGRLALNANLWPEARGR